MPRIGDVFPSRFIKAEELAGRAPATVTIESVDLETIGEDRKLVAHFIGAVRGLVLNRTNARALAEICGSDDTDNWLGARIRIVPIKVNYQGRMVASVRVEPVDIAPAPDIFNDAPPPMPAAPRPAPAPRTTDPFGGPTDDGMPF